jgi:hypothetical protein
MTNTSIKRKMADPSKLAAGTEDIAIKIVTHILDAALDIEIKKNADRYFLLVILSKSKYYKENGKAWNGKMAFGNVRQIANAAMQCYRNPSVAKNITINDGKTVKIRLQENGSDINFAVQDIYGGTVESTLMQEIFSSINAIIKDPVLEKYREIFDFAA